MLKDSTAQFRPKNDLFWALLFIFLKYFNYFFKHLVFVSVNTFWHLIMKKGQKMKNMKKETNF